MLLSTLALSMILSAPLPAPEVTITSPVGGYSSKRVCTVTGTAKNAKSATLVINGTERPLQLDGRGDFKAVFMAVPGQNFIEVQAQNKAGVVAKKQTSFYAVVPDLDLQVLLYWDTDKTDVDLHIVEPNEEECYYGHRETASGGMLDVDDVDGYGPEVYTLASAPSGVYTIFVQYFSDNGKPQSLAVVDVTLHPGTAMESRLTFEKMLTHTGSRADIGQFRISADGKLMKVE